MCVSSSVCGVIELTWVIDVQADPEFMDITWRLSVTSRTPGKVLLADAAGRMNVGLHGLYESDSPMAHAAFELMSQLTLVIR